MHISDLNFRNGQGVARADARIVWEDGDWPAVTFFADVSTKFADALWPDPNAFLIAGFFRGWRAGERRLRIDAPVCPVLFQNLKIAADTLRSWYRDGLRPPPLIEPGGGFEARKPSPGHSIVLLSCGIDSLATLRTVTEFVPRDHPSSIAGALLVAFDDSPQLSEERLQEVTAGRMAAASQVAGDTGIDAIPMRTNLWFPGKAGHFFSEKAHGAIFSALATFLSKGFSKAYIASSYDATSLRPWGSHPLLDPRYGSAHFCIEHHGTHMSRSDKIALVADWPAGLHNIRVCQNDDTGTANCGTCRKCIKTMTALLALGKLEKCRAFPRNDVDAALLQTMEAHNMIDDDDQVTWCRGLLPVFEDQGRNDLAVALEGLAESYTRKKPQRNQVEPAP